MGFLIRMAFWLSLVLLFIPFDIPNDGDQVETVGPIQAFLAARDAVGDVAGMCERKPDVCEVGRSAVRTIGLRARETARVAYAWIDDEPSSGKPDTQIMTGSIQIPPSDEIPAETGEGS